jgi:hypothetical protein
LEAGPGTGPLKIALSLSFDLQRLTGKAVWHYCAGVLDSDVQRLHIVTMTHINHTLLATGKGSYSCSCVCVACRVETWLRILCSFASYIWCDSSARSAAGGFLIRSAIHLHCDKLQYALGCAAVAAWLLTRCSSICELACQTCSAVSCSRIQVSLDRG